jgi:hypothetical protein
MPKWPNFWKNIHKKVARRFMLCHYVAHVRHMNPIPWVALRSTHGYPKVTATRSHIPFRHRRTSHFDAGARQVSTRSHVGFRRGRMSGFDAGAHPISTQAHVRFRRRCISGFDAGASGCFLLNRSFTSYGKVAKAREPLLPAFLGTNTHSRHQT